MRKKSTEHPKHLVEPTRYQNYHQQSVVKYIMMIGIKYLRYHPTMKFQMSSGLAIYESKFLNSSGGRGVIGGLHRIFTLIHQNFESTTSTFFTEQYLNVRKRQPLSSLVDFKEDHIKNLHQIEAPSVPDTQVYLSTAMRVFEEVEATGSEITYRCPQCRSCKICKHESTNDLISVKEEIEHH